MPDSERGDLALYRSLLGARFDVLPQRVRELHDLTGHTVWIGRTDVERGQSWLARKLADLLSLPPEGKDQPLGVSFVPVDGREGWTRWFGTRTFVSIQYERNGMLAERIIKKAPEKNDDTVTLAYRAIFGRNPASMEREQGVHFLQKQEQYSKQFGKLAALTDLCHALLMSNEFLYVE